MDCEKSDADNDMKTQGVTTKINVPDTCANTNTIDSNIEFSSPTESFSPENEDCNDPIDSDVHPDGVIVNEDAENVLVVEEDEGENILCNEILDDAEDFESDDEFAY